MTWTDTLKANIEYTYKVADNLVGLVDDEQLSWKPATGTNWMTTGQLLKHMSDACGACFKGFVTGDWGFPAGVDPASLPPEQMLPPAAKMPAVASTAEAKQLLAQDKRLALEMLARVNEQELETKPTPAPWDPRQVPLGPRLMEMVGHLAQHKGQLYYYLKLQGKDVNTGHLWGA
jgi:uncharacterized damage-inducible protein DinB